MGRTQVSSGGRSKGGATGKSRAREKIRAQRAAEAKRKRRRNWLAGTGAAAVAAAVAISVALTAGGGPAPGSTASGSTAPGSTGTGSTGTGGTGTGSGTGGTGTGSGTAALHLAALSTLGPLRPAPAAGPAGPEGVPVPNATSLAGTAASTTGQTIDNIGCSTNEQTVFHIHAHLTIFVNGSPRQVPAAIGIPGAQAVSAPGGPFVQSGSCFYWLHTHAADGIIHIESPVQRTYTLGEFFDEWGQPLSTNQAGPAKGLLTALYNGQVYRGDPRDIPLTAHAQIQLEVGTPLIAPVSITFTDGL
jgi:hypothetical protein